MRMQFWKPGEHREDLLGGLKLALRRCLWHGRKRTGVVENAIGKVLQFFDECVLESFKVRLV